MSLILSGTDGLSDVDGTAATPAIRGTDANTGIFFPAADTIAFSEGGAECARFNSSGNLGIGNTSPSYQLSLSKAGATYIEIKDTSGGVTSYLGASTDQLYIGNSTNHAAVFYTNNAERMRINAGAPILCLSGGSTTATGTGIAFPATQSASSDANTLDDYEEGTFTPILADSASSSNAATMSVQEGFYTKIGNTVTIQIQIVWSSKGSMGSGNNTRIYGIPFNSRTNSSGYYWPALITMSSGNTGFVAGQEGGGTVITLELVNAPQSELSTSYVSTSGRLLIQYTYRTA